eukprot:9954066-Alexandrium_andersonii.AAC.1
MVSIDVLHCMDLGATQAAVGHVLWAALHELCEGKTKEMKLKNLWGKMKDHYRIFKSTTQLQTLTMDVVKRTSKSPKLKAKGAETCHVAPFAVAVSYTHLRAHETSAHL